MQVPCRENQITLIYYRTLLELGLRHKTQVIFMRNGNYSYNTYHLIFPIK